MKKNYIQPQVKETKVALQQIIAVSGLGINSDTPAVDPSTADAKDDIFGEMDLNRAMEILDEFDW